MYRTIKLKLVENLLKELINARHARQLNTFMYKQEINIVRQHASCHIFVLFLKICRAQLRWNYIVLYTKS